jgi:predicted O-methyltransferase YrrM
VILYNIIRGTNKVYTFDNKQSIGSETVYSRNSSNPLLKDVDLVDTTQPQSYLITKCPRGFTLKQNRMKLTDPSNYIHADQEMEENEFKSNIEKALQCKFTGITQYDALPEKEEEFEEMFLQNDANLNMLMRRITGLTSYFPDIESLMPRLNAPEIIYIPMTDTQFQYYDEKRISEREQEKKSARKKPDDKNESSSYKIKSRLACNFAFPVGIERPVLVKEVSDFDIFEEEPYQEADEIVQEEKQTLQRCYSQIKTFFGNDPSLVATYSPKFDAIANKINRINGAGKPQLHLVYSQFLSLEGLNFFALMLQLPAYGEYVAFDIVKEKDKWTVPASVKAKQNKYVLYTGAMEPEKREIIRNIFNKDMDNVPLELHSFVENMTPITVFMITSAGAEGISLLCVQNVHIMEPYWNPIRIDQVIGRARRICSHATLPEEEQYVNVFKYIMVFDTEKQKSRAVNDKFNKEPNPVTTDEYLMKLSIKKDSIIRTFQTYIQDSAIDSFLYKNTSFFIPIKDPNSLLFNYNSDISKDKSLAKLDDTYLKNKKALDDVSSIIDNPYIYDMFYSWSLKGKQVEFDANITPYEACFITKLIRAFVLEKKEKKDKLPLYVVEIGLARGTSAIIILNELIKHNSTYTAIDMNQTEEWKNMGRNNIDQFLRVMKKLDYPIQFMEEPSAIAMPKLRETDTKIHISFIDGSHEEADVLQDIENSDKLLVKNGLIILANANHKGVKEAILQFMNDRYRKVSMDKDMFKTEKELYPKIENEHSVDNPNTMICLQKIK